MKLSTRQIALTGILLGTCAVLVNTPLGMIPVPTPAQYATIMHIPVIIVGILEGPLVGGLAGLLFGILAFLKVPAFGPVVHILPRPFVGIIPALIYTALTFLFKNSDYHWKDPVITGIAALVGSLINTSGVLGLAVVLLPGLIPPEAALVIAGSAGIPEAVFSVVITVPIVMAIKKRFSIGCSPVLKDEKN